MDGFLLFGEEQGPFRQVLYSASFPSLIEKSHVQSHPSEPAQKLFRMQPHQTPELLQKRAAAFV